MAHRMLKAEANGGFARIEPRLRVADARNRAFGSPARALHGAIAREMAPPLPADGTVGGRLGMIALFASFAWAAIGSSAFYLLH